jgi:hypothetical protein
MTPWIIAGVSWALVSVPIGVLVGSLIRAAMEQREENECRAALRARRELSFGFVERVEPLND